MSFRKQNRGLSGPFTRGPPGIAAAGSDSAARREAASDQGQAPGIRPSPLDGRPTTSTGAPSLDGLLAGHAGLALGNSLLLEEGGTTDYAGTLLRYYAAEGVVQGHAVHVIGVGEHWGRELPGLVGAAAGEEEKGVEKAKMKIAWRYERLGEFGGKDGRAAPTPNRGPVSADTKAAARIDQKPFCHTYDLTKRLPLSSPTAINFIPVRQTNVGESPFRSAVETLAAQIESSKPDTIHRILIPTLLSPAFYPPHSSTPQNVLQFLHSLRALLRQYSTRLTLMLSLPLTLYPRSTGLVRWIELLSDGVLELVPFPHVLDTGPSLTTSGAATAQEEKPQGMVKVHRLPVFHERGGGGLGADRVGDDLAFTVSRRKFVIKPFSLPPVEGDTEAQRGEVEGKKPTTMDIDF